MPRQDTRLEAEAAEFLVVAQLLLNQILSYKTYTNMPGYDVVSTDPNRNTSARIQVKSRWRTDAPHFVIGNFDCDFVVVVRLNRGSKDGSAEVREPEYFVFPTSFLETVPRGEGLGRIDFKKIPDLDSYRARWDLVSEFLETNASVSAT